MVRFFIFKVYLSYIGPTWTFGTQRQVSTHRFDHGPTTIIRREQEGNVFIPCPFSGLHFPLWIINDVSYEIFHVPQGYIPSPYGLLIPILSKKLNGTTFQCRRFREKGNNISQDTSTIGTLIVL